MMAIDPTNLAEPSPAAPAKTPGAASRDFRVRSSVPFYAGLVILTGVYVLLIVAMLVADIVFLRTPGEPEPAGGVLSPAWWLWKMRAIFAPLASEEIQYALKLSLISCTITAILSLWVAVPFGYLMSRFRFRGKALVDAILDIPIVLPPLVVGLSLLILFQTAPGLEIERMLNNFSRTAVGRTLGVPSGITFAVPSVILAQFAVACAFAVRTMRVTFDQISPRQEQVALTLGCSRGQAFWKVVFPEARRGMVTAGTLAWARSLGEFGPILVFSSATRLRTEVLPTTVYLELNIGNIETALAVSVLMILAAAVVLIIVRVWGLEKPAPDVK
jgi:molybdate transport system permease protein